VRAVIIGKGAGSAPLFPAPVVCAPRVRPATYTVTGPCFFLPAPAFLSSSINQPSRRTSQDTVSFCLSSPGPA
jgi:hypothetical protein